MTGTSKLTKQEEVFVTKVAETGNLTEAAQEGFGIKDPNYAGVKGHRLIRKDKIIEAVNVKVETLKSALEKQGVTPEKIAKKIDSLLEDEDGSIVDKGLKHATAIYGVKEEGGIGDKGNTYNFLFSAETQADVKAIEEKIKARLSQKHELP